MKDIHHPSFSRLCCTLSGAAFLLLACSSPAEMAIRAAGTIRQDTYQKPGQLKQSTQMPFEIFFSSSQWWIKTVSLDKPEYYSADSPELAEFCRGADVIVLSALLEHLPEPEKALAALSPLLAQGGRFVIYLPADGPILLAKAILKRTRLGGLIRGLPLEPAPGHLQCFDRRAIAALLEPHGHVEELTFDPLCLGYLAVLRSA